MHRNISRTRVWILRLLQNERGVTFTNQLIALAIIALALTMFVAALTTTTSGVVVVKRQVSARLKRGDRSSTSRARRSGRRQSTCH